LSPRPGSPLAAPVTEFRLDEFEHVSFRAIQSKMGDPYARPSRAGTAADRSTSSKGTSIEGEEAGEAGGKTAGAAGVTMSGKAVDHYGGDMFAEIQRYAALASEIARQEEFDVVHAHDWMTFPAGLAVAGIKGVPLVVHVHSTEFDRSGVNVDTRIYDIERRGMHGAMKIIAVSILTKNIVQHHYGIEPGKVEVVYNAVEVNGNGFDEEKYKIHKDEKIV